MFTLRRNAALLMILPVSIALAKTPVRTRRAMVVAQEPLAADVGVRVLRSGGNAVDAAVAVGFALAATYPFAGNIGGGGFLLLRTAEGQSTFVDFRETAPAAASRDMYLLPDGKLSRDSIEGWRASGVPGTVRGLELAHRKYGRKPWEELLKPAVELARGFRVSSRLARSLRESAALTRDPESRRIFQRNGEFYRKGQTLRQPELAATLERIAREGASDFYEGETARRLVDQMAAHGGLIRAEDLRAYRAVERQPLSGTYKGYEILTAPPPSSGGIGLLQMLAMLEGSGYEKTGWGSPSTTHFVAEVMRRFYADRSEYMGDPDFYRVPVRALLAPGYVAERRASIRADRVTPSTEIRPGKPPLQEPSETTHYAVVDDQGNAVAVTYTINAGYGSGVTVPGLGFLLNNEMDDFAAKPGSPNMFGLIQGEANAIAPGKRPLSAMTPTIVLHRGKLSIVLGSPGGPRIISAVLQVFLNIADFGMNAQDAVDAPRIHHQWMPDELYAEARYPKRTVRKLEHMGHQIDRHRGLVLARVEAIRVLPDGQLEGGSDRRGGGKAAGY
jgi:gamma-glutamyltranspeptidase/glutathione hydrolase